MARLGLGDLVSAGPRAVGRYTGTLLAVFLVQTILAIGCMIGIAALLAQAFSHLPMWDEAVDGDLYAFFECIRYAHAHLLGAAGIALGALLLWQLASWFLVGGTLGVLAHKPEGRGETARTFGASGATTYLAYARLELCALPGYALVLFALALGLGAVWNRVVEALTLPQLFWPLVLGMLPALLLLHVLWTAMDYARVELTLRHESHDPGAVITYLRTLGYVLRRPVTLVHAALGWLVFFVITIGYAYLAHGHPMYGAEGAIALFVIRQGVALARSTIRYAVLSGQVEIGRTRALPPRRIETQSDSAKS
ncbi:MAG: hypothetical protein JO257_27245 [Deltaproteobacteria bacterium]|nr:hypothetical protein [Deltaproteobacteria bacterium]